MKNLTISKKTSPNGMLTIFLTQRCIFDRIESCDPVEGAVLVDDGYLKGRKVYGQIIVRYQYGREDDEVMGIKFSREYVMCHQQIYPLVSEKPPLEVTEMQTRLIEKVSAHPFILQFPSNAPSSVELQLGPKEKGKPLGVSYRLECYVAEKVSDQQHKRNTIVLDIKKLQCVTIPNKIQQRHSMVCKGSVLSVGKIDLEVLLNKGIYFHGDDILTNVNIINNSSRTIEKIKCYVMQHTNVTMIGCEFITKVISFKTRDGCPIKPGKQFMQTFILQPLASSNKSKRALALDGYLKDEEIYLASSTLAADGKEVDSLGIVVSYTVKVELSCGPLEKCVATSVPFKLIHSNSCERE